MSYADTFIAGMLFATAIFFVVGAIYRWVTR